jgi:hypothetical protein
LAIVDPNIRDEHPRSSLADHGPTIMKVLWEQAEKSAAH